MVLPPREEYAALAPKPGSPVWRAFNDVRMLSTSGYATLLQVAHPTVGNGVREHSNYRADPLDRLLRTVDFVNLLIYGGPDAAIVVGRCLRETHKRIKGVGPDGKRYHALEPEAYAWVHATLLDSIVLAHERFGRPLGEAERQRFCREWIGLGRVLGVREGDLPPDWDEFRAYFDRMVAERLEDNDVVQGLLVEIAKPAAIPKLDNAAWKAIGFPMGRALSLSTVGLLPEILRERFGRDWTRANEFELRALGRLSRSLTPVLPASAKVSGPNYIRWRRRQMAKGEFAAAAAELDPLPRAA